MPAKTKTIGGGDIPGDAAVERLVVKHASEVVFRRGALIGVHEVEERLAEEQFGLLLEVGLQNGVEVDEIEGGGQHGPICAWNVSLENVGETLERKCDEVVGCRSSSSPPIIVIGAVKKRDIEDLQQRVSPIFGKGFAAGSTKDGWLSLEARRAPADDMVVVVEA